MVLTSIFPKPMAIILSVATSALPTVQVLAGSAAFIFSCMMIVINYDKFEGKVTKIKEKFKRKKS